MKLWQTRRHWESFAEQDPYWAVLSDPNKSGNRWNVSDFFATGRAEIDAALATVQKHTPLVNNARALDFGCGVGRLTQGLAGHFRSVTGVDISAAMVRLAQKHNRYPSRVEYVHNTAQDLRRFPAGAFNFICSLITLQHMAPTYSLSYLREFMRVLAPDGIAFVQVPTRVKVLQRVKPQRVSFWPPTVWKKIKRQLKRIINKSSAHEPLMEMYAIPTETLLSTIRETGGELVYTCEAETGGDVLENRIFIVRRRG